MQASTPSCSEYSFAACTCAMDLAIIRVRNRKEKTIWEKEMLKEPEWWDYLHNNLKISSQIDKQKVLHAL
jgi:hypothetical protein